MNAQHNFVYRPQVFKNRFTFCFGHKGIALLPLKPVVVIQYHD